jgi:hypothetical protein
MIKTVALPNPSPIKGEGLEKQAVDRVNGVLRKAQGGFAPL